MTPKQFQALQKKWYSKLSRSGFEDIEDSEGRLIRWSNKATTVYRDSQAEYYRWAAQCIHDQKFPSRIDKKIWTLHASGMTEVAIAKEMRRSTGSVEWRIRKMRKLFRNANGQ